MLTAIHSHLPTNFWSCFSLPKPKKIDFDYLYDLDDLTHTLTSGECDLDQWMMWKNEIKTFVHKHGEDLSELDTFLKTITAWGMERNPQKTMAILVDILSLEVLTNVVCLKEEKSEVPFENIFDWAAEQEPLCPESLDTSLKIRLYAEWRMYRPFVLYFIPNIINIFLGAFNFLDSQKKFTTLWEKHLLLEIIYKFFIIPYCLIKILQPVFVVTAKVYLVAALIIVATGILVSCYQRWLRPLPDEIVNCTNLDKKMEAGLIDPKVGQAKELERLIDALEVDSNVLLIGKSGEGKTALLHHFVRLKHEGKLSEKLQQFRVYEVDGGLIISSINFGHSELINQIKDQVEGYDDKVLFFFDEFYQIADNKAAFQAFKKRFLEDKPHSKFIAAMTYKEFQEIKKLDMDGSFRRRVVPITVHSFSDEQNRLVLRELVTRVAKDIPVTEEAIEAILDLSASEDYLPGIGRPAKAIKILMDAIGLCRASYNPKYVSVELSEARQEYQSLKLQAIHDVKVNPKTLKKIRKIKIEIEILEKKLKKNKMCVLKIKKIIAEQENLHAEYYRLTHLLAKAGTKASDFSITQEFEEDENILEDLIDEDEIKKISKIAQKSAGSKESISQHVKIRYLWTYFYAIDAMKKILQCEIENVRNHMPVQVDEALICDVYAESLMVENDLDEGEEEYESEEEEIELAPVFADEKLKITDVGDDLDDQDILE